jgi:hypothetical protein
MLRQCRYTPSTFPLTPIWGSKVSHFPALVPIQLGFSPSKSLQGKLITDDGNIQIQHDDKPMDFTVEGVTELLGGLDEYAGVARSMARNERVESLLQRDDTSPQSHFGIR